MSASRRWLPIIAAAAMVGAPAADQQQFRAGIDLVHLPVIVTGRNGQLVRNLTAQDFGVLEDGRPQKISYFAEGAPGDALPLHLGLALDGSTSMERDLRKASDAIVQFVRALEEAEDVTFLDFDTSVRVGFFKPASYPHLFERIRARKADGWTALYDALGVYLERALSQPGQHVLVLYTDGGDSTSRMTFSQLTDLLRLGNVIVYVLGYLENQSSSLRAPQQMRMNQIARETGGEAFYPGSVEELHEVYAKILDELGSRYTMGYVSTNLKRDGRFREVQVRLTRSDLKGARIRTRSGYIALAPPQ
ncbi:MAG TPA: VWA domain-containing protein [Vicinamibacterales bacterium]|nr:VWA domain-containing protein [Vicinamibacterales bacterium]